MVAYNYYINFLSKPVSDKGICASCADIITVKEDSGFEVKQYFAYYKMFISSQGRDIKLYSSKYFSPTQEGDLWGFEVVEVALFFWISGSKTLSYIPLKRFTEHLLEYWTLHIVLPLFFTIEETYDFLHAGAVEVEGKPILFVAESFGGKSTMMIIFLKKVILWSLMIKWQHMK